MASKTILRRHEILGLCYQFFGCASFGIGFYYAVWFAVRPVLYRSAAFVPSGAEWLVFPLFFGLGGLLWTLGHIEVKEALPGHRR